MSLEFRVAIRDAIAEEMERDDRVIVFGEDVALAGGVFKVTADLHERFGDERVFDTPISELALAGAAYGSALTGLRPIVEIMFGDFLPLSMDNLINQASKHWFLSAGTGTVPMVVRSAVGGGGRFGAIHSQMPAPWLQAIPGLKIVCPSTPADAKGLMTAAIRDENPVVFLEHKTLYSTKGESAADPGPIALGRANVVREGSDITLVSIMRGVHDCLAAADALAADGIADAEVVDLRSLRPVDLETVLASVTRTGRVLVVEEGPRTGGWATGLLGEICEHALGDLDDAAVLACPDTPVPFAAPLEDAYLPGPGAIEALVRARLGLAAPVGA